MAQIDDLLAYVNFELPKRSALETFATVAYDGDPNDGAAPSELDNAPLGTWFHEETADTYWRKNGSGVWEPAGVSIASLTYEALTIPVDYNEVSAVDPPVGAVFSTQAEWDGYLTSQSATHYKNLQAAYDALPQNVLHDVDFNVVLGIQRPTGATSLDTSWYLDGKNISNTVAIRINGVAPSTWPVFSGLSSISVLSVITGANPSISFSGTPFSGLDLKGRYLVANTGQVMICHDNDDSTLYVLTDPSPTPTSITVAASTGIIFRNSLTDAIGSALNSTTVRLGSNTFLKNITVDPFGKGPSTSSAIRCTGTWANESSDNVLVDMASYYEITAAASANVQNGIIANFQDNLGLALHGFIYRPPPKAYENNNFSVQILGNAVGGISAFSGAGWYIRGTKQGAVLNDGFLAVLHMVFEEAGGVAEGNSNGFIWCNGRKASIAFSDFGGGKTSEIRGFRTNTPALTACVELGLDVRLSSSVYKVIFTDNTMPCLRLRDRATLGEGAWEDGGSNTDVGIDVEGPRATLDLQASGVTVTGTVGDVRLPDASIESYANIAANGPFAFLDTFSRVEKAT